MPNKRADGNVVRSFSAPAELVDKAATKAREEDTNLSAVIRDALTDYTQEENQ